MLAIGFKPTVVAIFALAAVLVEPPGPPGTPPFAPPVVPFDAEGARGLASLDFDGEGPPDVGVALFDTDEIGIIPGAASSPPARGPRFAVGDGPIALVAGDLDGDGHDDLVVLNFWSTDLSILLGRSASGFAPERRQSFAPGAKPNDLDIGAAQAMVLADFDADGHLDLAVATRLGINLLRGAGDGSFTWTDRLTAGDRPFALVSGDFDADGRIDLAASHIASDDVAILLGRGDGTFDVRPGVHAGTTPRGLAVGDLDGDGILDLVTGNQYSGDFFHDVGDVSVLLGAGAGALRPAVRYRTGTVTTSVVLGDFDEDGRADIAALNNGSGDVSILPGVGDGTFGAERRIRAGLSPLQLLALDRDGDGHLDLASTLVPGGVVFLAGQGDGTFATPPALAMLVAPVSVALADLDGDGHQDLIVGGRPRTIETVDVAIFPGRGDGSFDAEIDLDTHEDFAESVDIAAADLDGDGLGDLVQVDGVRSVGVTPGRPGWTFGPTTWTETGAEPIGLVIADFNRDGHPDLAVAHDSDDGVAILLGRGDGGFDPGARLTPGGLSDIATADLDQDGVPDLAAVGAFPVPGGGYRNAALVWRATGDGGFAAPLVLDFEANPGPLALGDIDGDGLPDLVVTDGFRVTLFRNLGGLAFAPGVAADAAWFLDHLLAVDVTGDGLADVVGLSEPWEVVSVLPGRADGTLGPEFRTIAGLGPAGIAAADLDGDGGIDLVTANRGLRDAFVGSLPDVSLLLNRTPASNSPPRAVAQAPANSECTSPNGAPVRLDASASSGDLTGFAWYEDYGLPAARLLGSEVTTDVTLGLGAHALTLVVTDRAGREDSEMFSVVVEDTAPPVLSLRSAGPSVLWPPNHRLVDIGVQALATDLCGTPSIELLSIVSSEPDDAPGGGDGRTTGDIRGATIGFADFDFQLRAERSDAGPGRTYTAAYRARDRAGNSTEGSLDFIVPHDARRGGSIP